MEEKKGRGRVAILTPGVTKVCCGWAGAALPEHIIPSTIERELYPKLLHNEIDDNGSADGRWLTHPAGDNIWEEGERWKHCKICKRIIMFQLLQNQKNLL